MGSKSSSKQNQTNQDFVFNNVDNREGGGDGISSGNINLNLANSAIGGGGKGGKYGDGASGSGSINITQSDLGSISQAFGFGGKALDFAGDTVANSLTAALDANERATENAALIVNRGLDHAATANRGENERLISELGKGAGYLLAAGLVGAYILKKA